MKLNKLDSTVDVAFAVQYTGRDDHDLTKTVEGLKYLDTYGFSVIPFSLEMLDMEDMPTDRIVVPFGGTKLVEMFQKGALPANWLVFYDEQNFNQMHYGPILGNDLLNTGVGAAYVNLGSVRHETFAYDCFMKPVNDLKAFAGVVVPAGITLNAMFDTMMHQQLYDNDMVVIAPWKNLGREFRTIVAFDQIVGISQYKNVNNVIEHKKTTIEQNMRIAVKWANIHSKFKPSDVYTIDFVEVDGTLKVVEYNCFNCSGLYEMDRTNVYTEVAIGISSRIPRKYLK